jgi:hypothetical protein
MPSFPSLFFLSFVFFVLRILSHSQVTHICAETQGEKMEWVENIKFNIESCDSTNHRLNPLVANNLKRGLAGK